MFDQSDEPGIRDLCRALLVGALKDLGSGTNLDKRRASRWPDTHQFVEICELIGWDPGWVREVFYRIDELDGTARHGVCKQCVHMLKYIPLNQGGEKDWSPTT